MDFIGELLAVVLVGLAAILTGIATASAIRYREARLGFVASALALFALVGVFAVLEQFSPLYGSGFSIDRVSLVVLVAAVALLYASLVGRRGGPGVREHE